jgi:hypothetical protein
VKCILISLLYFLTAGIVFPQQTSTDSLNVRQDTIPRSWSFEAEGYYYIFPHEKNTITLMGYADYKAFHSEIRYNYEDLQTVSVFGGYRFTGGHQFTFELTPVLGFAFGNTNGIIPGFLVDLNWKKFDFYSESEYVIDFEGKENYYFYTWSELGITPFNNFRTGISANRTKLFHSALDFQRGIFAEYSLGKFTGGVHYFNPFSSDSYVIVTLDYEF